MTNQPAAVRWRSRVGGIYVGRIAGVAFHADWSLLIIIALVAINLGAAVFPLWHPTWSLPVRWLLAITAALLLVASIAGHELAHALVGRQHGIPIPRVSLFVFGGIARMEREPTSPRAELAMAAVGPLVSIGFGLVVTVIGLVLAAVEAPAGADLGRVLAAIGPVATLLLWLGPINIALGVFNLVPGFPLDGGRVLRAGLWAWTHDLHKATRWAASAGYGFGLLLMAIGVVIGLGVVLPIVGGGPVQGIWLLLIGWFLSKAASQTVHQEALRATLHDVHVEDVMRPSVETVAPQLSVAGLAHTYVMRSDQMAFPVVDGAHLVGMVHVADLRDVPQAEWEHATVGDIMTPVADVQVMHAGDDVVDVLAKLADHDQVPVVDGDHLIGVARRGDLVKWMTINQIDRA